MSLPGWLAYWVKSRTVFSNDEGSPPAATVSSPATIALVPASSRSKMFCPTPANTRRLKRWGWAIARRSRVIAPSENPIASTGCSGRASTMRSVKSA
jgi:hypothetical protein